MPHAVDALRDRSSVETRAAASGRATSTRQADAAGYHSWRWRDVFERAFGCHAGLLRGAPRRADRRRAADGADQEPAVRPHADVAAVPQLRRRDGGRRRRGARAGRRGDGRGARARAAATSSCVTSGGSSRPAVQAAQGLDAAAAGRRRACGRASTARSATRFARRRSPA